jgi:hypothetical protein
VEFTCNDACIQLRRYMPHLVIGKVDKVCHLPLVLHKTSAVAPDPFNGLFCQKSLVILFQASLLAQNLLTLLLRIRYLEV